LHRQKRSGIFQLIKALLSFEKKWEKITIKDEKYSWETDYGRHRCTIIRPEANN
jgi:hypothetical protein